jgi:hypothetical protein
MRRLVLPAFAVFVGLGAFVGAGELPEAASLVDRHQADHLTPYVRGGQGLPEAASLVDRHQANHLTPYVRGE